jgi:hypothetical protein
LNNLAPSVVSVASSATLGATDIESMDSSPLLPPTGDLAPTMPTTEPLPTGTTTPTASAVAGETPFDLEAELNAILGIANWRVDSDDDMMDDDELMAGLLAAATTDPYLTDTQTEELLATPALAMPPPQVPHYDVSVWTSTVSPS